MTVRMIQSLNAIYQFQPRLLFILFAFTITSACTQNKSNKDNSSVRKDTLKSPVTFIPAIPEITSLDTCPAPKTIPIPARRKGFNTINGYNGPENIQLAPPEIKPAGFFAEMHNYNTEQGLALNTVTSSCVDKYGNLWFGTEGGGVSRYDGKSFTNFTTKQGLANNTVWSIAEDKNGNLWFGTFGGGVSCYDGRSFRNYTTAHGLADNFVFSIIEDKSGALWFGTLNGGASRYNGESFVTYDSENGLGNNSVWCLLEDKKGILWFATDAGVSRYDGKSFVNFSVTEGLASNNISCIIEDKMGNLWFGTYGKGVSLLNQDKKSFTTYDSKQGLAGNYITSIFEDIRGNLWFGTFGGGISLYDGKSFTTYTTQTGLTNNSVRCIIEDKGGNLWFGTHGSGISRLDGNWETFTSYTTAQGLGKHDIGCILEDKKRNLWFGTKGGGVSRYDGKSFTTYTTAQGLPSNAVLSMFEDKSGNIWLGTDGHGISRLDKDWKSLTTYNIRQGLANYEVRSIFEDESENLWFGTEGGRISRLDKDWKTFTNYTVIERSEKYDIQNIHEDNSGNLWFATNGGGITSLDRGRKAFARYTTAQGLASNNVSCIFEDKSRNLWFGTKGGGVSRLDPDRKYFTSYSTNDGMGDDVINNIIMDKNAILWFGTNKGFTALKGFVGDIKKTSDSTQKKNLAPSNEFSNYKLETSGFKPVFEIYNNTTGFPIINMSLNTTCITRQGIIWAGTSEKLVRFDYSTIHKNPEPLHVFLQGLKINNEPICWHTLMQYFAGGSMKHADNNLVSPDITEEVTLFGRPLSEKQRDTMYQKFGDIKFDNFTSFYPVPLNIVLPYRHNNITFDFAAIEPARPHLVHYQYILEGYDKEWNPVTDKTTATFGNMQEGNYTFQLKALSSDGVWSVPITYTFTVMPPWYRTWWAYSSYILIFLVAFWSFIKWRVMRLKKEKALLEKKVALRTQQLREEKQKVESSLVELKATQTQLIELEKMASLGKLQQAVSNERLRISRELHDEVGATLSSISIFSQAAIHKNESGNMADSRSILERIGETSRAVMSELNDAVWLINPRNDNLQKIMQRISNYALPLCRTNDIHFEIKAAASVENLDLSVDKRKAIYLIIKEAVNNSLKYAAAKNLIIQFEKNHKALHISIKDDGIGFVESNSSTGNGLKNMKQRAKDVNGQIDFDSVQQRGTEIILQVPLTNIGD